MNSPHLAIPNKLPCTVDDAIVYDSNLGPWNTKSGGRLDVLFALDEKILNRMLQVDPHELSLAPALRLGIRAFHSSGLAAGSVGGEHFHRIKDEIIAFTKGSAEYILEDLYGGKRKLQIGDHARGLYIPPFIMHTYTIIEAAELIGVSNTLYDPDDPTTHDTFDGVAFQILQHHYVK